MTTSPPPIIRVPNLPTGQITDNNGNPTDDELTFRHTLITNLQKLMGNEGLVAPTQTAANITLIQNNTYPNPATGAPVKTCQFGTILYNSTDNSIMISIDDGSGNPIFKTVTLT